MTDITAKLASGSRVEMMQFVMPGDGNGLGTAFGGRIMQWIDLAAAMAAQRHCRMPVVTASIGACLMQIISAQEEHDALVEEGIPVDRTPVPSRDQLN